MTNQETIKALRDALSDIRDRSFGTMDARRSQIHTIAAQALALTADASEDAPDADLGNLDSYWLTADGVADTFVKVSDVRALLAARPAPVAATPAPDSYAGIRLRAVAKLVGLPDGAIPASDNDADACRFAILGQIAGALRAAGTPTPDTEAEAEAEEDAALIHKLAKMLAEIAVTLKGEEAALHRHSYHDLPELVTVMALELDIYRTIYGTKAPDGWENGAAAPAAPIASDTDENAPWLTLAHMICADAGIPCGHITDRLKALRDKLEAAPIAEVTGAVGKFSEFRDGKWHTRVVDMTEPAAEHAKPEPVEQIMKAIKAAPANIAARRDMTPKGNMSVEFPPVAHAKLAEGLTETAVDHWMGEYDVVLSKHAYNALLKLGQQAGAVDGRGDANRT